MAIQLYLRTGGKLRQWRGDADGLARLFAALPANGTATIATQGPGFNGLFLRRTGDGKYRLRVVDQVGPGALGHRASARRDFTAAEARRVLDLYLAGDPAWRSSVAWKRGLFNLPVVILAPATILVCVAAYFVVAGATGALTGWSWRYLPNLVVGLVMVCGIFAYADWFFRSLRKRIAGALGRAFGLRIVESQELGFFSRPGMWESADGGIVSELKVTLLDLVVMLLGLVIPIFAIGTAIVLAARPIMA